VVGKGAEERESGGGGIVGTQAWHSIIIILSGAKIFRNRLRWTGMVKSTTEQISLTWRRGLRLVHVYTG
jgi:hypothetical protein